MEVGSGDTVTWAFNSSGSSWDAELITTQVFRDPSAWYHFLCVADTTQATASNRLKLYVNGTQVTTFSTATYPSQNTDLPINSTQLHQIGRNGVPSNYFSGYLADIHFIDGQALDPTSFGEFDDNGIWQPKAFAGSYGTNGFRLDFSDNSAATATTLGKDRAGSNNWTPNNLSVTAGAGNDSLVDVPTNGAETDTGVGGQVRGNYCTWNPLDQASATISNGNLDTSAGCVRATLGLTTGKWYWEQTVITKLDAVNNPRAGVAGASASLSSDLGSQSNAWVMFMAGGANGGKGYNNSTITGSGSAFSANDVGMFAYDADAGKLWFGKNGSWLTGDPATDTSPFYSSVTAPVFPVVQDGSSSSVANFGQRPFAYTAPSGFKALNTANLPAPLVTKPSEVFDVVTYMGNAGTQSITGLAFNPDFVWIKGRDATPWHALFDSVRGTGLRLSSNVTNAETGNGTTDLLQSFNSNGFTVNATLNGGPDTSVNWDGSDGAASSYVAWTWDAGSSTVTNTVGSISSQVRANASAGFSIVTWTGNGTLNASIGHGLGVKPALAIIKNRSSSQNWPVFTDIIDGSKDFLYLNTTAAKDNASSNASTSTLFYLSGGGEDNGNTNSMVGYFFAPVAGYSNAFSYTGNGSSDGPFCFLGFRPRFLIIKRTDAAYGWYMYDTARDTYNIAGKELLANSSDAEVSDSDIDILSNGFKPRRSSLAFNASGGTFIGFAWAEHPFQYARAR
jgi:hypothetical protein